MHKNPFYHRGLACVLAAALAVAAPGVRPVQAASRISNAALLSSEMPAGKTLATASNKEVAAAVHSAVSKRPSAAAAIVAIAIKARKKSGKVSSAEVADIVSAAISAAPGEALAIAEAAQSVAPNATNAINAVVSGFNARRNTGSTSVTGAGVPGSTTSETTNPDGTTLNGDTSAGPGFPGSPGFSGSSPSGGSAFANGFGLPAPSPAPSSP